MKTIFIDIDGTIVRHNGDLTEQMRGTHILPGVINKFNEWNRKGYCIVLTTGRKECMRSMTEDMLLSYGIFYDKLIMGLPRGQRVLINDSKPDDETTALSYTVKRNVGIESLEI